MNDATLSPDQVRSFLESVEAELQTAEDELDALLAHQRQLQDRRKLLQQLLASFELQPSTNGSNPSEVARGRRTVRERVHDEVVEVLRTMGEPMHINDLLDEYVKQGYRPPGQGKPANLSVHLSGWDDVVSPKRGVYALSEML